MGNSTIEGGYREPTHYPLPMAQYGLNPYGENLFRIVYAPSVLEMVGGRWPDGREEYRWVPKYDSAGAKDRWILEMWRSAWDVMGCSLEQYELNFRAPGTSLLINGPYPVRGEYKEAHIFQPGHTPEAGLDKLVGFVGQALVNRDPKENLRECRRAYQAEEKTRRTQVRERIEDLLPNPNGAAFLKKMKSTVFRSANELGMAGAEGGRAMTPQQVARMEGAA